MSTIRKLRVSELLKTLIIQNDTYTVSHLLHAVLRNKNFKNTDAHGATDAELASAIEKTIKSLEKEGVNEE